MLLTLLSTRASRVWVWSFAQGAGIQGLFPRLGAYLARLHCTGCFATCKFGFYKFFKKYYSDIAGPEYASKYKTLIYLAGSASAEVIAHVAHLHSAPLKL